MVKDKSTYLANARRFLELNLQAIEMIENGKSEYEAMQVTGLSRNIFRKMLFQRETGNFEDEPINLNKKTWVCISDYEFVFAYIMGARWNQTKNSGRKYGDWYFVGNYGVHIPEDSFMPFDLELTMPKLLQHFDEIEKDILFGRAVRGETLQELADRYRMTREGVRHLEEHILQWLRTPYRLAVLTYGNDYIEKERKANKKLVEQYRTEHNSTNFVVEDGERPDKELIEQLANSPISELNLIPRSYNALRRNGVDTIGELLIINANDLIAKNSIGVTIISQIDEALREKTGYGLRIGGLPRRFQKAIWQSRQGMEKS